MWSSWRNRGPVRNGLIAAGGVLAAGVASIAAFTALAYDGRCGGFIPFLAGPRPCAFLEYFGNAMTFTLTIIVVEFWWIVAPVVALPVVAGVLAERFRRQHPDPGA